MKASWEYLTPRFSNQPAPHIRILIKNPLRDKHVETNGLVDTGYDGFVAVPEEIFLAAGLDEFEVPFDRRIKAETYSGETINIRNASGEIIIPDLDVSMINDVDAVKDAVEVLIGRKLLEMYIATLNGSAGIIDLTPADDNP